MTVTTIEEALIEKLRLPLVTADYRIMAAGIQTIL